MAQREAYNGAAAYDVFAANTARPLERPNALPEAPARRVQVRKVKTRPTLSPMALLGAVAVLALLVAVVFGYVRLYEAQSEVGELQSRSAELSEEQARLRAQYESAIDPEAIEARALALGLRQPTASQKVYVQVDGNDTTELFEAPEEKSLMQQVCDAFCGVFRDAVEYFS